MSFTGAQMLNPAGAVGTSVGVSVTTVTEGCIASAASWVAVRSGVRVTVAVARKVAVGVSGMARRASSSCRVGLDWSGGSKARLGPPPLTPNGGLHAESQTSNHTNTPKSLAPLNQFTPPLYNSSLVKSVKRL